MDDTSVELQEYSFTDLYREERAKIRRMAHTAKVPGMTYDEIVCAMEQTLWKAWCTYDYEVGATFDTWWHRCWITDRIKLIEKWYRQKNVKERDALSLDAAGGDIIAQGCAAYGLDPIPLCPSDDPLTVQVWNLLSRGYLFKEVQTVLGVGRKTFDRIIDQLRDDPKVHATLGLH